MSSDESNGGNIYQKLIDILKEQKLEDKFKHSVDIHERLKLTEDLMVQHELCPKNTMRILKNNEKSLEYRERGDESFNQKNYNEALESYNKSIAFAENDSKELTLGYLNRSSVYFALGLHRECLRDIQLAKESPTHLTKLQLISLRKRTTYCDLEVKKPPKYTFGQGIAKNISNMKRLTQLTYHKHPKIPFISSCIELAYTIEAGRSIKTNRKIKPGDIVITERPFTWFLYKKFKYKFCTNCLKQTYSLIPCSSCTSVMFCNENCMKIAYEKFHKYECQMINYLFKSINEKVLLSVRLLLQAISLFKSIDKLIKFEKYALGDTNIFAIEPHINDYKSYDEYNDFSSEMKEINYYPMHAFIKVVKEPENRTTREYTSWAVDAILAAYPVIHVLKDFIITDEHKRFIRYFLYRHNRVNNIYSHELADVDASDTTNTHMFIRYGLATYTCSGLINHSCAPNIYRVYDGSTVIIVALRMIWEGEQLFECYRDEFHETKKEQRQSNLKQHYDIDCKCDACENNFPSKLPIGAIPHIDETMVAHTETVTDIFEALINLFNYLIKYSPYYYPCLQVHEAELQVMNYHSSFIRNIYPKIYNFLK